jgi:EAL domain-containing protein (putative c-di-GMP-specific phosphodiesterase class I)
VNELIAGTVPRDPLLGWAGLDASGRIVSLGGGLAAGCLGGDASPAAGATTRLVIGMRLADALQDADAVERFIEAAAAGACTSPVEGAPVTPSALPRSVRCRIAWATSGDATAASTAPPASVELLLRCECPPAGAPRFAAEFHALMPGARRGPLAAPAAAAAGYASLVPPPIAPSSAEAADTWRLGSALLAATVAPAASRPTGLIRFALHPVALPRLAAVDDLDPWIAAALARLASSAAALGIEAVAARTGTRELTVWVRDGTGCAMLCEHWLSAMTASPLVGSRCRLVVGPTAAWCVMPADGQVLGYLLDALDAVYEPADPRPSRPPIPVSSLARERDVAERREALTGTLVELVASGRARLAAEPIIDAPTGLQVGMHLRAEFRSLFAVAELIDYLPDIVDDEAAADALNAWLAAAIGATMRAAPAAVRGERRLVQVRIAPAQLRRLDSLVPVITALTHASGGASPCLMLPEAAVHRDAYLVIDAVAEVTALGAMIGVDDYRGLLPPLQLAQAGIGALRLHRSLVRELGERSFACVRLGDLLARGRSAGMSVLVAGLSDPATVAAAGAAGALHLSGPVFGRPQRFVSPPVRT